MLTYYRKNLSCPFTCWAFYLFSVCNILTFKSSLILQYCADIKLIYN